MSAIFRWIKGIAFPITSGGLQLLYNIEIKITQPRWVKMAVLIGSALLLVAGPLRGDEDITKITKQKAASLLQKGKYQELDALVSSVKAKGYNIAVTYPLYSGYAYWLLPKWYGERGDWEAFVTEVANTFPGIESDILYANLVQANSGDYGDDLFTKCEVDYPRVKKGLQALIAGGDVHESAKAKNRLCYLSAIKGDYETAKPLFFQIRGVSYSRFFDGVENLRRLRALSGAQAMIDSAYALEKKAILREQKKRSPPLPPTPRRTPGSAISINGKGWKKSSAR